MDEELERQAAMINKMNPSKKHAKAGKTGKHFDSAQYELDKQKSHHE